MSAQQTGNANLDDLVQDLNLGGEVQQQQPEPAARGFQVESDSDYKGRASIVAPMSSAMPTPLPKRPKGRLFIGTCLFLTTL